MKKSIIDALQKRGLKALEAYGPMSPEYQQFCADAESIGVDYQTEFGFPATTNGICTRCKGRVRRVNEVRARVVAAPEPPFLVCS